MKQLLHFNTDIYNCKLKDIEFLKGKLQHIVNKFNSLNIGSIATMNDLHRLIFSARYFIYERNLDTVNQQATGVNIYDEISKMITLFFNVIEYRRNNPHDSFGLKINQQYLLSYFEIDSAGTLQIKPQVIQKLKDEFGIYLNGEKAQLLNDFSTKLSLLINETDVLNKVHWVYEYGSLGSFIEVLLIVNQSTQKTKVNIDTIKYYDL